MLIDFENIVRIHFSLREKDTSTYLVGTLVWFWAIWKCNGSETRDCRHPMWRCTPHWSLEPDWLGTRCLSISELVMWQKDMTNSGTSASVFGVLGSATLTRVHDVVSANGAVVNVDVYIPRGSLVLMIVTYPMPKVQQHSTSWSQTSLMSQPSLDYLI